MSIRREGDRVYRRRMSVESLLQNLLRDSKVSPFDRRLPERMNCPSGEKETEFTGEECPLKVCCKSPARFQSFTVLIVTSGEDELSIRREGDRGYIRRMSVESLLQISCEIPKFHRFIETSGEDELSIRREGDRGYIRRMSLKTLDDLKISKP